MLDPFIEFALGPPNPRADPGCSAPWLGLQRMHTFLMCTYTDHATGPCDWPANLPAQAVSAKVWRYLVLVSPSCALHRRNKFGRSAASNLSSSAIAAVQPSNFVQFCFLLRASAFSFHGFLGMACSPKIAKKLSKFGLFVGSWVTCCHKQVDMLGI
jgi:hypothetical protein